jgi:hypothetical protein
MQFFPHNISSTNVAQATSASLARTVSFLNNFASVRVDTASVALNFVGTPGTAGTNFTKIGETGLKGIQGERGPRGDNAYILAVGWSDPAPSACIEVIDDIGAYNPTTTFCNFENAATFYSTTNSITGGSVVYYDSSCSSLVMSRTNLAVGNKSFSTDGSGVVTLGADCAGGSF